MKDISMNHMTNRFEGINRYNFFVQSFAAVNQNVESEIAMN